MEQLIKNKLQSKCTITGVDHETFEAVYTLFTVTFLPDNIGRGKDAKNLSCTNLLVTKVYYKENLFQQNVKKIFIMY